jgi:hypothetical protein
MRAGEIYELGSERDGRGVLEVELARDCFSVYGSVSTMSRYQNGKLVCDSSAANASEALIAHKQGRLCHTFEELYS